MDGSHSRGGGGDGGGGSSSGTQPAFLIKTYEMVEDPDTDHVVSWGPDGASFVVWNPPDLSRDLLPSYFKHNNFSSFIRQLNTYGFRKIDPERWEFANEDFIRGRTHLLKNIHRRKPVHRHTLTRNQATTDAPPAEPERREFEEEISRLKHEKSRLLTEHQKRNQQRRCSIDRQVRSLEDRLVRMERRQKKIVASLRDVLLRNGPAVVSGPRPPSETTGDVRFGGGKKRRVPLPKHAGFFFVVDDDDVHSGVEERHRVPLFLQTTTTTTGDSVPETATPAPSTVPTRGSGLVMNVEPLDRMDTALVSLEKFIQRAWASDASVGDSSLFGGSAAPTRDASLGGVRLAPVGINIDLQSTPEHARSHAGFAESSCFVQSPVLLSLPDLHEEDARMTADADMNSDSTTAGCTSQDEATSETGGSVKVNDLFWERFLTQETPKFFRAVQADSGRQDDVCKREPPEDVKMVVDCTSSSSHHRDRVDQITEQMGQLASAENA